MSGLKPLGPAYPVNRLRPVKGDEERRQKPAKRKPSDRKGGDKSNGKIDEYA